MTRSPLIVDLDNVIFRNISTDWLLEFQRRCPEFASSVDVSQYDFGLDEKARVQLYIVLHDMVERFYESAFSRIDWNLVEELERAQDMYGVGINFVTYAPPAGDFAPEAVMKLAALQECLPSSLSWSYSASATAGKLDFAGCAMIEDNQVTLDAWCARWQKPGILIAQPWNSVLGYWRTTRVDNGYALRLALDSALISKEEVF